MFESILKSLDGKIPEPQGDYALFPGKKHRAFPLSAGNFHGINKQGEGEGGHCAFIDGGQGEILSAPNFSLQFIRTVGILADRGENRLLEQHEFYTLIYAEKSDGRMLYKTEIYPVKSGLGLDAATCSFSPFDKKLVVGTKRASIAAVGSAVRRFAELATAEKMISQLSRNDLLVLDGSLEAYYSNERPYLDRLYAAAQKQGCLVLGLSKTSDLMTDRGSSLTSVLSLIAPKGAWYYHPIVGLEDEDYQADIYCARLNASSDYVFRVESASFQSSPPDSFIPTLASLSNDLSFPGYPYPLVLADQRARVSGKELGYLQAGLMAEAGPAWQKLRHFVNALNAHDILNRL